MSPEYLAGFLDGEGCFTISRGYKRPSHFSPVIFVANTNEAILHEIVETFGGAFYSIGIRREGSKPIFKVSWSGGANVLRLLNEVEPYLRVKKLQAALVRKLAEHLGPSKQGCRGLVVSDAYVLFREELKQQIHVLNKRGTKGETKE